MSTRNKDPFSEAIVGIFMLAVLALLVYFTIIISGVDVLQGRKKITVGIEFSDVGGLKAHDNVMYRGTKVGTVDEILLSPSNLTVKAEIDRDVVLRSGYRAAVCNLSMLGGNYLLLEEGEGEILPLETTAFKGETPTDWMRDVSNIAKNLNEFTSGGELKAIVTNIEAASAKVLDVVTRVERGEGTIGKLLSSDDSVYRDISAAVGDAKAMMSNANIIVARVERGEGTVGKLLSSDDTVYNDLKSTLASANEIARRLRDGEGVAGRLLAKDDPLNTELDAAIAAFRNACESFDAKELVEGANKLVASLTATAQRLENGEGTIGKLINDPTLYEDISALAKDARQVLDNFRDTTPISTFGSLVTGGL